MRILTTARFFQFLIESHSGLDRMIPFPFVLAKDTAEETERWAGLEAGPFSFGITVAGIAVLKFRT